MQKILFPTDFSEVSNNAFLYALKLADVLKAEIVTLHVYDLPFVEHEGFPNYLLEMYDVVELGQFENFKARQAPHLREIAANHNLEHIPVSHELRIGDLLANINEMVRTESIDYVVMGTKGASGLKETFLGSTASSVISDTSALVLAIPSGAHFNEIRNIAFTSRFREKDRKALEKVVRLARSFNAKVHCLYVKTPASDVREVTIKDWQLVFANDNVDFHIIENNDVEHTIIDFTTEHQIDMLAMLHYKRGFLEQLFHFSLTRKIVNHISIPILALHDK